MKPPTPSQVPSLLDQVLADVAQIRAPIHPHGRDQQPRYVFALDLAADTTYGPASANLDPTTSGSGSDVTLTPTEAAAARHQGRELRDEVLRAVADLEAASRRLRTLVVTYTSPAEAQAARSSRPITDTDDACELFALVGHFEQADRTSDCAGNLARKMRISRPAYDRVRAIGRMPTKAELGHYARTGRWPKTYVPVSRTAS